MSTLQTTILKHPDSASNQVTFTAGGDINFDSGAVFIDSSNNRVGIGTTSPNTPLHIKGGFPTTTVERNTGASGAASLGLTNSTNSGFLVTGSDTDFTITASTGVTAGTGLSERLRIDSSGRLLVGASSSFKDSRLQVKSRFNTANGVSLLHTQFSASASSNLNFLRSRDNFGGNSAVINGSRLGQLNFGGYDGTDYESFGAAIYAEVDGTPGANDMPGRLVFSTTADGASSPTERMRINAAGNITGAQLGSDNSNIFVARHQNSGSGTGPFFYLGYSSATSFSNGTYRYSVGTNGDVKNSNNSYGATSDIKLKENIVNANSQWSDLKALQVRNYNFKEETGLDTFTQLGVVAQEVELVSPGLVSAVPDIDSEGNDLGTTTKSVNYSVLYMKAVKALQEAMERIETLETKVAALEAG